MCDIADELDREDVSEETRNKGKDNQNKSFESEAKYATLVEPKKDPRNPKVGNNATSGESDKYYEVDRLLKVKFMQNEKHYLVKWKGQYKNTWEPENYNYRKPKREFNIHRANKRRKGRKGYKYFK